jgi:hypothetical protein
MMNYFYILIGGILIILGVVNVVMGLLGWGVR